MNQNTCPVCNRDEILPPHGVCQTCYARLEKEEVRTKEQIEQDMQHHLKNQTCMPEPEMFEKRVISMMQHEQSQWRAITKNGLKAVTLATIVVDAAAHLPNWRAWHRRRVAFMGDLIEQLPLSLFAPATRQQLRENTKTALSYWDGNLTEDERKKANQTIQNLVDKKTSPSDWDEKCLPIWMTDTRDLFDWMWEQFIDCIYECVPREHDLSDAAWMTLFQTHFADILQQWVNT